MRMLSSIRTIAAWEMKRSMTTVGRHVLPLAAGLLLLLILATALAAQGGIHMQDGMYGASAPSHSVPPSMYTRPAT